MCSCYVYINDAFFRFVLFCESMSWGGAEGEGE